ncbi:death-associated protein 1 [Bacillus rossius redtenbacheri]|uniref:death-associated protein 1 n=1 Tax=Bacillus rossius redtenbacheri TaxID=93214 RepID=UPI002FDCFA33
MSSTEESDLKAGHPPAVKAGGMRITQHKGPKEDKESKPSKEKDSAEVETGGAGALKVSTSPPKTTMISGAPVRGHADFPAEAVQSFHEKPVPTHDARSTSNTRPNIIQQPRK